VARILDQGRRLECVVMANESGSGACRSMYGLGNDQIESITVQMELGQCSYVPWALVKYKDPGASDELLNLAYAMEVFLADDYSTPEGGDDG